jgi:pyridoxal 5'-phosphate synthase pdxT subunit
MKIGVLAVQGNFREHLAMLAQLGVDGVEVRLPEQLDGLDGLIVPGGESTAIGRLVRLYGLVQPIVEFPGSIFGTCAGMILLAREAIDGVPGQPLLGLLDITVLRNGYGRQVASFEADLELAGDDAPLRGVFIRAPRVVEVGSAVEVLAELTGDPVLVRQGRYLAAAFHPELTADTRVHGLFLDLVSRSSLPSRSPGTPLVEEASERREGTRPTYGRATRALHPGASGARAPWRRAKPGVTGDRPGERDVWT